MVSNTPFQEFKTTDEKHDLETYIGDMIDYCIMQNWYDASKESEQPSELSLIKLWHAARTVYKYSLGLSEADLKKPHSVVSVLGEYHGASVGLSGERQKLLRLLQQENESKTRNQAA